MHLGSIRFCLVLQVNVGVIGFILYDKLMQHTEIEINKCPVLRNVQALLLNQSLATIPLAHMKEVSFCLLWGYIWNCVLKILYS